MTEENTISPNEEGAALEARQRRIERRRGSGKRTKEDSHDKEEELDPESDDDSWSSPSESKRKTPRMTDLSFIRGIKKQARYEPEVAVPMTKAELAAWRKEARRVRNRESAAASRNKTRTRIEELESQVSALQARYDAALQRIAKLEVERRTTTAIPATVASTNTVSPQLSPQQIYIPEEADDLHWTLPQQQAAKALADSLTTYSIEDVIEDDEVEAQHQQYPTHQNIMISRPTAV